MGETEGQWCLCGHPFWVHRAPGMRLRDRCSWCACADFEPENPQARATLRLHRAITHSVAVALERANEEDGDADTP